jgi:hypothetical protein
MIFSMVRVKLLPTQYQYFKFNNRMDHSKFNAGRVSFTKLHGISEKKS